MLAGTGDHTNYQKSGGSKKNKTDNTKKKCEPEIKGCVLSI